MDNKPIQEEQMSTYPELDPQAAPPDDFQSLLGNPFNSQPESPELYSYPNVGSCPDCGSGLVRLGGCTSCPACGFAFCG